MTAVIAQPQRTRHAGRRQMGLALAHQRLMLVLIVLMIGMTVICGRLVWIGFDVSSASQNTLPTGLMARGDIVDRNGQVLARTIEAWSVGVHPTKLLGDPDDLAVKLADLMPERTVAQYREILKSGHSFAYLRRRAMPELVAQVNALGEPAMAFAREPERLYPQVTLAAHAIGFTDFDGHGVMGMERVLDGRLGDPEKRGAPVALSIDMRVQAAMESELFAAMTDLQAEGATGLVMDVQTGELIAMVSLPVFNPNKKRRGSARSLAQQCDAKRL